MSDSNTRVYLAGPIRNVEDPMGWRDRIVKGYPRFDYDVPEFRPDDSAKELVEDDLERVRRADVVIARWVPGVSSPGTAMEIREAHTNDVPVIVLCSRPEKLDSKFIKYHATTIVDSLGLAVWGAGLAAHARKVQEASRV